MENNTNPRLKIVFFDGVCHLCNGFVDKLIQKDTHHSLYFAPLQGTTARKFLTTSDTDTLDSIVFYDNGRIYRRSEAVLGILKAAGYANFWLKLTGIFPNRMRDVLYKIVAKYRYRVFGKNDICRLPLESEKKYLLP